MWRLGIRNDEQKKMATKEEVMELLEAYAEKYGEQPRYKVQVKHLYGGATCIGTMYPNFYIEGVPGYIHASDDSIKVIEFFKEEV